MTGLAAVDPDRRSILDGELSGREGTIHIVSRDGHANKICELNDERVNEVED